MSRYGVVVPPMEMIAGLAVVMALDIRYIRLRTHLLAVADPKSELYRRNLPQKSTFWNFDSATVDRWSESVVGCWWFGRLVFIATAGLVMAVVSSIQHWFDPRSNQETLVIIVPCLIFGIGILPFRQRIRRAKGELATAKHLHEEASMRAGLRRGLDSERK